MCVDDFQKMSRADLDVSILDARVGKPKARERLGRYVTGRTHAMQGDPGHLRSKKWALLATVRADGCPTDWSTGAYNDINLPDLHNHRILPYTPDLEKISPENVETRQRMAWNNPATCALWFMIRRLTPPADSDAYDKPRYLYMLANFRLMTNPDSNLRYADVSCLHTLSRRRIPIVNFCTLMHNVSKPRVADRSR